MAFRVEFLRSGGARFESERKSPLDCGDGAAIWVGGKGETIMQLELCRIIDLPKIADPRGNLTFVEAEGQVPFAIRRVYYLYDVPGGTSRGGHAHRKLEQFIVAMSGSFDVVIDDGFSKATFSLNRSYYGLYLPQMVWRELTNFSSGSVCLAIVSTLYDEADYIRDHDQFLREARGR